MKVRHWETKYVCEVFDVRHGVVHSEFFVYFNDRWQWIPVVDFEPV